MSGYTNSITDINGNVGIGTTSSGYKLDVSGNIKLSETAATTDTDKFAVLDTGVIKYRTGTQVLSDIGGQAALTNPVTGTGTTNYLSKFTGTSTLGDSLVYDNGTNVGIGTSSPDTLLHLFQNNQSGDVQLKIDIDGYLAGSQSSILFRTKGTSGAPYTSRISNQQEGTIAGNLVFETGNANERMRITSTGNVGIGTTSPTSPLNVKGANTSSTTSAFRVENVDTSTYIDVMNNGNINQKLAGFKSTSFGSDAGKFATSPYYTAFGSSAGGASTTGGYWSAVGAAAGASSTTGQFWGAFGFFAGRLNTTGNFWNAIGSNAGEYNTGSSGWIAIGHESARYYSGGTTTASSFSNGVYIGKTAKVGAAGAQNEIVIGYEAEGVGSNSVVLGNDSITTTVLKGNVGIGTTSPENKLSVLGPSSNQFEIINSANSKSWRPNVNGNDFYITETGVSSPFVIQAGGNVGIGNTAPSQKLQVEGDIATQGIYVDRTHESGGTTSPFAKFGLHTFHGNSNDITLQKVGSLNRFNFSTQNGSFQVNNGAGAYITMDAASQSFIGYTGFNFRVIQHNAANNNYGNYVSIANGINTTGTRGIVSVNADLRIVDYTTTLPIENAKIGNDGSAYFNGNVGIGTTSPAAKLQIESGGDEVLRVTGTGATSSPYSSFFQDSTRVAFTQWSNATDTFKFASEEGGVSFWTGTGGADVERMRIDSTGNVGIGTTNPQQKLDVRAGTFNSTVAQFTGANDGRGLLISTFQRGSNDDSVDFNAQYSGLGAMSFSIAGSERMRVHNTGNVGIGTTSPGAKLDVEGDVLIKAANLSNQENTDVDTGTETVATVAIVTYTAAFFDFVIKNGTNVRSGTVYACHDGTDVEFTETSTADLGDTSDVTLSVDISGADMRLLATTTSDNWSVKTLVRAL